MVERKSFSGEGAVDYLGVARALLQQLVQSMQMNNLQVLSKTLDLPNGVRITVSSVFGQHNVRIEAPEVPDAQISAALTAAAAAAEKNNPFAQIADVVTFVGVVRITLSVPTPAPPPPVYVPPAPTPVPAPTPAPSPTPTPPPDPGGGGGGGDPGGGTPPVPNEIDTTINDLVYIGNSITLTIVTTTPDTVTTPAQTIPSIFIAGATANGRDAFVWDDVNGYKRLNIGGGLRRWGRVLGISPNGQVLCGSLEVYDSTINPTTVSPFTGKGGVPYGYTVMAAKWQSRNDTVQLPLFTRKQLAQEAYQVPNSGNPVTGKLVADGITPGYFDGGFSWDGSNNHTALRTNAPPPQMGLSNPFMTVSGQSYRVGGSDWINWGPNSPILPPGAPQAPPDAYALCCTFWPAPTPTPVITPGTTTVTTLVFSG